MKNIFLLFITLFLCCSLTAQDDKLISPKKLKKDFEELISMIEAHPSPYRHISEQDLNSLIDSIGGLLNKPMDIIHFYKLVSPVFSSLKDGHTSIYIPGSWLKKHRQENGVFPFKVYVTEENRLYIIGNYGQDNTIPLASEILSLNGIPVTTFIEEVSAYISYEQEIFRNTIIEEGFDFYLLLYFGKLSNIELEYLSDVKHKHSVNYISYDSWKDELKKEKKLERENSDINKPYKYKKIKADIALVKIYSFAIGDQSKYEVFLRKMFRQIKNEGIQSLIIDVRGNTGGFPKEVSELIHCVSEKYFKTMARSEMKVSGAYKEYFRNIAPSVNFHRAQFYRFPHTVDLNALFAKKTGTFVIEESHFNELPKEVYNEFSGDLYLLTDRRSYSASSSFAATFRCYQLGLIIGSETGGTRVFHANSMYQKLKYSKLNCGMATTRLYTSCFHDEDEGIKPDIEVKPTIQNLAAKNDIVLNYTLRVIKKIKRMREEERK